MGLMGLAMSVPSGCNAAIVAPVGTKSQLAVRKTPLWYTHFMEMDLPWYAYTVLAGPSGNVAFNAKDTEKRNTREE